MDGYGTKMIRGERKMTMGIFVGACDKSDHVIALATFLTRMNFKVLVVDATTIGRIGTEVSMFTDAKAPLVNWNGFDILWEALSWNNMKQLLERCNMNLEQYDHIIIDTDRILFCNTSQWRQVDVRFMVQTMERYILQKNLEWMQAFQQQYDGDELEFVAILSRSILPEAELNFIKEWYRSVFQHRWAREFIAFEEDERNWMARMSNIDSFYLHAANYPRSTKQAWRMLTEHYTDRLPNKIWKGCLKSPKKGWVGYAAM